MGISTMKTKLLSATAKFTQSPSANLAAGVLVGVSAILLTGFGANTVQAIQLKDKLTKAFPAAEISSVDCKAGPGPLCEVVAQKNVFYSDRDGRHAFVGSVLDMKAKKDLTDERLRQLAAMQDGEARIMGGAGGPAAEPSAQGPSKAAAGGPKVDLAKLATLPKANAVIHNPGAALKMTIFTDLNCSFCQRLSADLKSVKDIEVTEYLVGILGQDSIEKAKLVLCSTDRVGALDAIHSGGELKVSGDCAAAQAQVKANTEFFHSAGMQGTPVIIRGDGTVNEGWMQTNELRAFLGGR